MLPATATPASRLRLGCMAPPSPRPSLLFLYSLGAEVTGRHQQARGFRFALLSTSADVHVRRRHHALQYRFMEYLNRNLDWKNGSRDKNIPDCMNTTSHFWWAQRSPTNGAYANLDDIKSWSDDISGLRPSKATDHTKAESLDDLLTHSVRASKQQSPWVSFHHIRKYLRKRSSSVDSMSNSDQDAPTSKRVQEESFIDPITNRRVAKPQPSCDTARFPSTSRDEFDASRKQSHQKGGPQNHQAIDGNTPDERREPGGSLQHSSQKVTNIHDALKNYCIFKRNDHLSPRQPSAADASKSLADLANHKPVSATEFSTEPGKPSKEPSKACGGLERDATALRNESDNVCKSVLHEPSNNYPDLDEYGPVYFNEPDGWQNRTAADKSSQNEALDQFKRLEQYKVPFVVDDATLAAHEERQQIFAPKAEPISTKIEVPLDDPSQQYTDLDKYGPVYWNEPDVFKSSSHDLGIGSHYSVTEPFSLIARSRGADTVASCNESEPRPREQTGTKYEEPPNKRPDFDASHRTHAVHCNIASKVYTSLSRGGIESHRKSNEACSDPAVSSRILSDANRPSRSTTDGLPDKHCDESDDVHGTCPNAGRDSGDFRTAADIRADVLRRARNDNERARLQKAKSEHDLNWDETSKDAQDTLKKLRMKTERTLTGNYVQDFPQDFAASWSIANSPPNTTLLSKHDGEGAQSTTTFSDTPNVERDGTEPSSMDESFPSEETRLEPSLDRQSTRSPATTATPLLDEQQAVDDLYSKEPQGLETSFVKECGGQATSPFQAKHYEAKTTAEPKDAPAEAGEQSMSYRVLAYDAATGSLSIAETTSSVEDMQAWASPAAVLPRLSSPSKFLPHFARLHEQGYEIVAGGGDVLVFRKVRAALPEATRQPAETRYSREAPVNPIDLMGKPVTGNFASPTGFVNYDAPAGLDERKPSPPFRTSGGVADEERRGRKHDGRGRKRGFGRKLVIGTVWVTGIAYAAGVLGEYFATGGADGLGPTGF